MLPDRAGEANGYAKITEVKAHEICRMLVSRPDVSYTTLARHLDTSEFIIANISQKKTWLHVSAHYPIKRRETYYDPR